MSLSSGVIRRLLVALGVAITGTLLLASLASAHEHRHVGEFELTVGFLNEPAIVEEPNGLDLRVMRGEGDNAEPVEGLAGTLQAEIIYGDQRLPLQIEPRFGQPGAYRANIIPTATGAYTFHIFGTIDGTPVDETFTSGPDTFSEVTGRDALTFPNQVDQVYSIQQTASDANDSASTAMMLGIGGIVAGVLGLILGVLAFARSGSRSRAGEPLGSTVSQDAGD